jgi:tRNA threonylcarbamoyladenosine biosynthesis protein TsaE
MSPAPETNLPMACHRRLADLAATETLARRIAACLVPGFVLHLSGGLGAGKTTFTRALLAALGHQGRVKSPTFTLLEPYNLSKFELHHYDFYRLEAPDAWRDAGFEASFDGRTVVVIEWPEKAGTSLPPPDLHLRFDLVEPAPWPTCADGTDAGAALAPPAEPSVPERGVGLEAKSDRGRACLSRLADDSCCVTAL